MRTNCRIARSELSGKAQHTLVLAKSVCTKWPVSCTYDSGSVVASITLTASAEHPDVWYEAVKLDKGNIPGDSYSSCIAFSFHLVDSRAIKWEAHKNAFLVSSTYSS